MARTNSLLAEESSSAQIGRIARDELYYCRQRSTPELLDEMMGVMLENIHAVANALFGAKPMNLTAVGLFQKGAPLRVVDVG